MSVASSSDSSELAGIDPASLLGCDRCPRALYEGEMTFCSCCSARICDRPACGKDWCLLTDTQWTRRKELYQLVLAERNKQYHAFKQWLAKNPRATIDALPDVDVDALLPRLTPLKPSPSHEEEDVQEPIRWHCPRCADPSQGLVALDPFCPPTKEQMLDFLVEEGTIDLHKVQMCMLRRKMLAEMARDDASVAARLPMPMPDGANLQDRLSKMLQGMHAVPEVVAPPPIKLASPSPTSTTQLSGKKRALAPEDKEAASPSALRCKRD